MFKYKELNEWKHVGFAEGAANESNDSRTIDGVQYDFVFDVDVDQGRMLKLGYNAGEDHWQVAQKFIW